MTQLPKALQAKIEERQRNNSLRELQRPAPSLIDFASNDYLGFSNLESVEVSAKQIQASYTKHAKPGSRLLSGNSPIHEDCEAFLAQFYNAQSSVLFNSGYDANLGLISAIGLRNSIILYDELVHASIRDGIRLSLAKTYKFKHNSLEDLGSKLIKHSSKDTTVFVITESVFSMDGDQAPALDIARLCQDHQAYFILDQAHAIGVLNQDGLPHQNLQCFAKVVTFGKSFAQHGAVVIGSKALKTYLLNFSRSLIYTTAMAERQVAIIWSAHLQLKSSTSQISALQTAISTFKSEITRLNLNRYFIPSSTAIQSCVIPDNAKCKRTAEALKANAYNVKPILSPTVPKGEERLRFCLHAFNSAKEIQGVLKLLSQLLQSN